MADLVVDLDSLQGLVRAIRGIQGGLADTKDVVLGASDAAGDSAVSGAMGHFQSHWKDGRKHIDSNAETMTSMLDSTVQAFEATENQLAGSIDTSRTTTEIGSGR
jgi:hypothetical protein